MDIGSINEFKMKYNKRYHQEVAPKLQMFEKERVHTRNVAFCVSIVVSLVSFLIICFFCRDIFHAEIVDVCFELFSIVFFPIYLGIATYQIYKKDFEMKLKKTVMNVLMSAFSGFKWSTTPLIDFSEIECSKLFRLFHDVETDDNFKGVYKGIPIKITEAELISRGGRGGTHVIFKGVIISIKIPKKFVGHTIIKPKSVFNEFPYPEVNLEDPEFSKKFSVCSTDQVEARYLLTTAFIQRYKEIQKVFCAQSICASFLDDKLMLALAVNKDLFSLGALTKPLNDTKQFFLLFDEIVSVLELVEVLKLYYNIGM